MAGSRGRGAGHLLADNARGAGGQCPRRWAAPAQAGWDGGASDGCSGPLRCCCTLLPAEAGQKKKWLYGCFAAMAPCPQARRRGVRCGIWGSTTASQACEHHPMCRRPSVPRAHAPSATPAHRPPPACLLHLHTTTACHAASAAAPTPAAAPHATATLLGIGCGYRLRPNLNATMVSRHVAAMAIHANGPSLGAGAPGRCASLASTNSYHSRTAGRPIRNHSTSLRSEAGWGAGSGAHTTCSKPQRASRGRCHARDAPCVSLRAPVGVHGVCGRHPERELEEKHVELERQGHGNDEERLQGCSTRVGGPSVCARGWLHT